MDLEHENITVHGRVQGVGFRYSCRQQASLLGLKGFVKNQSDGTVYIEIEGDQYKINLFLKWCNDGPPHATVNKVYHHKAALENFEQFKILG